VKLHIPRTYIAQHTTVKDLGVCISGDLKWGKQCSQAVANANKVLGLIKRNFTDRSKETLN